MSNFFEGDYNDYVNMMIPSKPVIAQTYPISSVKPWVSTEQLNKEKVEFWQKLEKSRKEKNYKSGWSIYKFREKYGDYPPNDWILEQGSYFCQNCKTKFEMEDLKTTSIVFIVQGFADRLAIDNPSKGMSIKIKGSKETNKETKFMMFHQDCFEAMTGDGFFNE